MFLWIVFTSGRVIYVVGIGHIVTTLVITEKSFYKLSCCDFQLAWALNKTISGSPLFSKLCKQWHIIFFCLNYK